MSARARAASGTPVDGLSILIDDLATITRNTVAPRLPGAEPFQMTTPLQSKAFRLPGVRPWRTRYRTADVCRMSLISVHCA